MGLTQACLTARRPAVELYLLGDCAAEVGDRLAHVGWVIIRLIGVL